jgi:hypothetical protein
MKALRILTFSILFVIFSVSQILAQGISIEIDEILANEHIRGYVRNLSIEEYFNFKVVVYVHTDQWYIHPYAGQGEGLSWASIREDGSWVIPTVRREYRANQVAALLVRRNYPEPNVIRSVETIQYRAIVIKNLLDTPDYGKL